MDGESALGRRAFAPVGAVGGGVQLLLVLALARDGLGLGGCGAKPRPRFESGRARRLLEGAGSVAGMLRSFRVNEVRLARLAELRKDGKMV